MTRTKGAQGTGGFIPPDQQPVGRIVGRRTAPPIGVFPSATVRAAMDANARYLTRAPKGVFSYRNHEEMTRDRDRWTTDAIVARQKSRG